MAGQDQRVVDGQRVGGADGSVAVPVGGKTRALDAQVAADGDRLVQRNGAAHHRVGDVDVVFEDDLAGIGVGGGAKNNLVAAEGVADVDAGETRLQIGQLAGIHTVGAGHVLTEHHGAAVVQVGQAQGAIGAAHGGAQVNVVTTEVDHFAGTVDHTVHAEHAVERGDDRLTTFAPRCAVCRLVAQRLHPQRVGGQHVHGTTVAARRVEQAGIEHDRARRQVKTRHRLANGAFDRDADQAQGVTHVAAARGLDEGAVSLAQDGAVVQVLGFEVARQAADGDFSGGGIGCVIAARHQPLDIGIEDSFPGRVHRGQPVVLVGAGVATAVVCGAQHAGVEQTALGQADLDIGAADTRRQQQVAAVHPQIDSAAAGGDRLLHHQRTAGTTCVEGDVATGAGDRTFNRDCAGGGGHRHIAAAGLLQPLDGEWAGLNQTDLAATAVAQVKRGHIDLDRVEHRAHTAIGLDHQLRVLGNDVDAAFGRVHDLARGDGEVGAAGAAQLAQVDAAGGTDGQCASAGVDLGLAGHGQHTAAGECDVATGADHVAGCAERHVIGRAQGHVTAGGAHCVVEGDATRAGAQADRLTILGADVGVDRERATGDHGDGRAVGADQALNDQIVFFVDGDGAFGGHGQAVHFHRGAG